MLYRQKKDTFIRNYDGVGYITSTGIFNDRCTNDTGTVFLCALNRTPQTIDELVDKIMPAFVDVDREIVRADAIEFYDSLVTDGLIIKGESESELDKQDIGFTYKAVNPKTAMKDFTPAIQRADTDTQVYLEKHFKYKPHFVTCNEKTPILQR